MIVLVLVPKISRQSLLVVVYDAGACVDVKVLQTNISVVAFHDLSFVDVQTPHLVEPLKPRAPSGGLGLIFFATSM